MGWSMKCSVSKVIWCSSTRFQYKFDKTSSSDPMTSLKCFVQTKKFHIWSWVAYNDSLEPKCDYFWECLRMKKFQGNHRNVGRGLIKPILKTCLGTSNYLRNTTLCMDLFQYFDWAIQKILSQGHIFDIKILLRIIGGYQ